MKQSKFLGLNLADIGKSILVAFLAAAIGSIQPIIEAGGLPDLAQLKVAGWAGLTAAAAYLLKNFLTNSQGAIAKKDPK